MEMLRDETNALKLVEGHLGILTNIIGMAHLDGMRGALEGPVKRALEDNVPIPAEVREEVLARNDRFAQFLRDTKKGMTVRLQRAPDGAFSRAWVEVGSESLIRALKDARWNCPDEMDAILRTAAEVLPLEFVLAASKPGEFSGTAEESLSGDI
jgi:hypothetical protein